MVTGVPSRRAATWALGIGIGLLMNSGCHGRTESASRDASVSAIPAVPTLVAASAVASTVTPRRSSAPSSARDRTSITKEKPLSNVLGLHMKVTFRITTGIELRLAYEVANGSNQDVYLLNRLTSFDDVAGAHVLSPNVVLAAPAPESGVIAFRKTPAGPRAGVYRPIVPYVTPLRARSTFREEVVIALPVRAFDQYRTARGSEARDYTRASFAIGYYVRPSGTKERMEQTRFGVSVLVPETPEGAPIQFGEVASGTMDLSRSVPAISFEQDP